MLILFLKSEIHFVHTVEVNLVIPDPIKTLISGLKKKKKMNIFV